MKDEETLEDRMTEQHFTVEGMTCNNCVRHVTEALRALPGVTNVHVALENGRVTVQSEQALSDAAVRAALDEAGYSLA